MTSQWWSFFPVKGLDIRDKSPGLVVPLFGDATVLRKDSVDEIIDSLPAGNRDSSKYEEFKSGLRVLTKGTRIDEQFESFIAVRRSGVVNSRKMRITLLEKAEKRAREIAGLLGLCYFAKDKNGSTCGLVSDLHRSTKRTTMFDLQTGSTVHQIGPGALSHMILDSRHTIRQSRKQIAALLAQRRFESLAKLVKDHRPRRKSASRYVVQSLTVLSDALHNPRIEGRLLGAVTSIEILIGESEESYKKLIKRLASLVGDTAIDKFDATRVFQARHSFVHRGNPVEDRQLALRAIGLAFSSLLAFAKLSEELKSKPQVMGYLDFLSLGRNLNSTWSAAQRKQFLILASHKPRLQKFAFME